MIAFVLTALFATVIFAVGASLIDSALRWSNAFKAISRERALADSGFVPMVDACELRLRPVIVTHRGGTSRAFARRLPRPTGSQATDAAAA